MDVYIPYCLKEKRVWEEVYNCVTLFTLTSYLKVCFDFMHFRKFSWQQDSGDQTWNNFSVLQAVVKKCSKLTLITGMATERKLISILKSFLSIPLLPPEKMHRGLVILSERALLSAHNESVKPFLMYYFHTWMQGARYDTMSVFSHSNRQSNASDVAKRNLTNKTGSHYPNILHLIGKL